MPRNIEAIERELAAATVRAQALYGQHGDYKSMPKAARDELNKIIASQSRLIKEYSETPVNSVPLARIGSPSAKSGSLMSSRDPFAQAVLDSGFNLKSKPSVEIPGSVLIESKASTFPGEELWDVRGPNLVNLGRDERWLWPNLQTEDAGTSTGINDFRQTVRTLTGSVSRNLDSAAEKATLDVTLASVTEPVLQFAVVLKDIPNAVLESIPALGAFLATEGRFQVFQALDAHVLNQIVAATPAFGQTGATIIDQIRNGIATMRGTGADPDLLVLNPTDSAALDLIADVGGYVFPTRNTAPGGSPGPLWGVSVVERIGGGSDPKYLIDSRVLGVLYIGNLRVEANPYLSFSKNLTDLRVEIHALFHIRNIQGARRIAAT